jgi:ATP-binding cassette, subfamily F, member 3
MAVLTFKDLSKEFAGEFIFTNLSGSIGENSTIGIVGPNGIGKTTLLQLFSGKQEASQGQISKRKSSRIGYLPQEAIRAFAEKNNSIYQEMLTVFSHLVKKQEALRRLEAQMSNGDESDRLLEEYGQQLHAFEAAGGYEYDLRIEKNLAGLGFSSAEWDMPLSHCSGGQKTRVLLCRLLLEEPDLLIMDEPTNHLDAQAVEWLEGRLLRWEKAIIIVSHDRYFLDNIVKQIWEMSIHGIEKFNGNYSAYTLQRNERRIRREKTFDATMEFFMAELHFIRRFIDKKTTQAKGRMKRLVRHVKAVEIGGPEALEKQWNVFIVESGGISGTSWSVNELERHIKALKCQNPYTKPMKMHIETTEHLPEQVLRVTKAQIGYRGKELFEIEEGEIRSQQRVALLGPNGTGKSTFLRTILDEVPILDGFIKLGESIKVGYFAQAHDILDPEKSVVEELMSHKKGLLEAEARNYLGAYLFSNDDVFKSTRNLSGGERGRLTLAILALQRVNFLILDEPTNHLDIQSREILEDALLDFAGTILLVTHDRYLIDKIATHIWNIDNGKIMPFRGSYGDYRDFLEDAKSGEEKQKTAKQRKPRSLEKKTDPVLELKTIEDRIESLESELTLLSDQLETAVATRNEDKIKGWKDSYHHTKGEIQDLLEKWEELSVL